MENENKNTSPNAGNPHRHKNKSRKHKSYFIAPTETKSEAAPQNNEPKQRPAEAARQTQNEQKRSAPEGEKFQNGVSPAKNRNKRKKHVNKYKDNQPLPQQTLSAPEAKVEEVPLDMSAATAPFAKKNDRLEKQAPKKLENFSKSPEFEKYSDYEEFSYDELYGDKANTAASVDTDRTVNDGGEPTEVSNDEPMVSVVGIRFKASGKTYYFDPKNITLKTGSHAIVETARGLEYGEVALGNTMVKESETVPPLRPVIRVASEADVKHHAENKKKEDEAFRRCNEKIIEHELDMKLIDAQYTFDNSKLLFYFTSSGRVDFRELVKDLACVFRTRIELRQIGIRDEAKMVGGLGLCGRPLCCSLFLTDFGQVSIKMAKEQGLSLNSSKISGICGRLMCCLRYEHDTYEYEIKRTPPVDTIVRTVDGVGVVTETSPLSGTIKVRLNESPEVPPKSYKREDVSILKKKR